MLLTYAKHGLPALFLSALLPGPAVMAGDCMVIGHRGASGYLPEHTLPAYRLAVEQGADYIEPDIVITRDRVPIARHESLLSLTTDVAERPEFAERRRKQILRGREYVDWFSEDFTYEEIRQLRATERMAELGRAGVQFNGEYIIPTLQDVIDLLLEERDRTGRKIGLYPEVKQGPYFTGLGVDAARIVVETLERNGLDGPDDEVILQSFDARTLRRLNAMTDLPLVQLLGSDDPVAIAAETSSAALAEIATYADGIGVPKYSYVIPRPPEELPADPASILVEKAHAVGLIVHVYTLRAENKYLAPAFRSGEDPAKHGNLGGEIKLMLDAGVDGFFTDFPDVGRAICEQRGVTSAVPMLR